MQRVKRELKVFLLLFLFLALLMHFDAWIEDPYAHIEALKYSSLGIWHPLVITAIVYLFILLLKGIAKIFKAFKNKKNNTIQERL